MNDRKQTNLRRIDELWGLHEHRDPDSEIDGRCLAFAVGRRYLESKEIEGLQFRVGVSFGHNPFTPEMATGFVPPPVVPGRFVFGLHLVASLGNQLTIYDEWMDAREAGGCEDAERAEVSAHALLDSLSDEAYLSDVSETSNDQGPLRSSARYRLEDFEVVQGEAF